MCGRYALALVRRMLQDADMDVYDLPPDEGPHAPRQSYNFAPGYHGIVYRADVPDWGAGPRREHASKVAKGSKGSAAATDTAAAAETDGAPPAGSTRASAASNSAAAPAPGETHYKLQSMKWGLVPFWTKRNPDYASVLKTINCRDDSLASAGGMWASMKARKRCVVVAQGFFEWLKPGGGGKEKVPHFVKRKDGQLMCFAGLWDCVSYEDERGSSTGDAGLDEEEDRKHYTYTVITTDSNAQLKFLHDRMPVILDPGSEEIRTWLDPGRYEWTRELQALLKPFKGELEVYPVSKEVGKVGNNSPSFIIPVASRANKSNIANFFANVKGAGGAKAKGGLVNGEELEPEVEIKEEGTTTSCAEQEVVTKTEPLERAIREADDGEMSQTPAKAGTKREAGRTPSPTSKGEPPTKKKTVMLSSTPTPSPSKDKNKQAAGGQAKRSATSNGTKSPAKAKTDGSQKITKFFANSA